MDTVTTAHHGRAPVAAAPASGAGVPGLESGRGTLLPDPALLRYYVLSSLIFGPAFFVVLLPRYFRYRTLRYEFDDQGVRMHWGILFRREVSLTYSRIQDIHLTSNVLERWIGLAKIEVQTASGSAKAEMTIEGLREFEAVRELLYSRMRGAGERHAHAGAPAHRTLSEGTTSPPAAAAAALPAAGAGTELAEALHAAAAELRALREELARRAAGADGGSDV